MSIEVVRSYFHCSSSQWLSNFQRGGSMLQLAKRCVESSSLWRGGPCVERMWNTRQFSSKERRHAMRKRNLSLELVEDFDGAVSQAGGEAETAISGDGGVSSEGATKIHPSQRGFRFTRLENMPTLKPLGRRGPAALNDAFRTGPPMIAPRTQLPPELHGGAAVNPVAEINLSQGNPSSLTPQEAKLSQHSNADSLFFDCLDRIRQSSAHTVSSKYSSTTPRPNKVIDDFTTTEADILYRVLKRIDPLKQVAPNLEHAGKYIDPFWSPFQEIDDIRSEIQYQFSYAASLASTAEAMRERQLLLRAHRINYNLHNPLASCKDKSRLNSTLPNDPRYPTFMVGNPERLWDPSVLRRNALFNNNRPITWRDVHILKFFIAETGMMMPRMLTLATRRQQTRIFKALGQARSMAVFPYDWKPPDVEAARIEDPLQTLADVLTVRYKAIGNLRARAMLQTLSRQGGSLDLRLFFYHRAKLVRLRLLADQQKQEEAVGNFSRFLAFYKRKGVQSCRRAKSRRR